VYALVATIFILWPTDSTIANNGVSRVTYELTQFIPLAFIVVLTFVFYIWGHAEKRNQDIIVERDLETGVERASGD